MSGNKRFTLRYRIQASGEKEARSFALKTAYEQSVELPDDVLNDDIRQRIAGRVVSVTSSGTGIWSAEVSYSHEAIGTDSAQLLNILFGNMSLYRGIQLTGVSWDELPSGAVSGPAFGIDGVRKKQGISERRPLSCTALKPVGSSAEELAGYCYRFALGSIDIIKDDHGLANQSAAPFRERLEACSDAIRRASDKTGTSSSYYPNITADGEENLRRYEAAHKAGAGGVLLIPHLCGLPVMKQLADSGIPLPIMAHPAFSGPYVIHDGEGMSPEFLFGQLWKAFGADFSIYPNAGGRFSFSPEVCRQINKTCRESGKHGFAGVFPTPGGGMQRETLPELIRDYGPDTTFLIGGSLYQHPKGIEYASREMTGLLKG